MLSSLSEWVVEDEADDFVRMAETECGKGVRCAVIDRDTPGVGVAQETDRETDAGNKAAKFIRCFGAEKGFAGAGDDLPGFVNIQQHSSNGIGETVAGAADAVVEEEPAFAGFNGRGACTNLDALPPGATTSDDMPVSAPVDEVGTFARENIAEWGVSGIRWTTEHEEFPVDFFWEKDAVAVVGEEGVFELFKGLEVLGSGETNGGAVVSVAPSDVIGSVYFGDAGIVSVFHPADFFVFAKKVDRLGIEVKVEAVATAADMQMRNAIHPFGTEDANESAIPGNNGRIVDSGDAGQGAAADERIGIIAPEDIVAAVGAGLPGNIGKGRPVDDQVFFEAVQRGVGWGNQVDEGVGFARYRVHGRACRNGKILTEGKILTNSGKSNDFSRESQKTKNQRPDISPAAPQWKVQDYENQACMRNL